MTTAPDTQTDYTEITFSALSAGRAILAPEISVLTEDSSQTGHAGIEPTTYRFGDDCSTN